MKDGVTMKRFSTRLLAGFIASLLLVPSLALAQNAKITGRVTEAETGDPLPGANVRLAETGYGAATNQNGEYTIFNVSPGTYTVVVSFVGYRTVRRQNVEIISGVTKRLDFELETAEFEGQEVVVTAEEPLVNPTATNAVRQVGREEIASLPTRSSETYYSIQPGVTVQNGEVHIRGGRSNETDYLLDGLSSRSLLGTNNVVAVIPEALEETQVFMGGYAANRGGANGGIVQQTLRTGGSEISALAQYEGDGLADSFNDTYSYGDQDAVLTVGGPLYWDNVRFFVAGNYRDTDNDDPLFWSGAQLNEVAGSEELCGDVSQSNCHPPVDNDSRTGVQDTAAAPLQWGDGNVPGLGRPREEFRINSTLTFDFDPLNVRLSYVQTTVEQRDNDEPITNFFNQKRLQKEESVRRLASLQPTYFINEDTYVQGTFGFFQFDREQFDPLVGKPGGGDGGVIPGILAYQDRNAVAEALGVDPSDSTALENNIYTRDWQGQTLRRARWSDPPDYNFNGFGFDRPGQVTTSYSQRDQSYWQTRLELVSQQGSHQVRFGGEYKKWTVRNFSGVFPSTLAARRSPNNQGVAFSDSIRAESESVARLLRDNGVNNFGYDEFGNEIDDGPDGPKEPVEASAWINDKIEFEDIIVSAGLRFNYYDMDLWEPAQGAARVLYDGGNAQLPVGGEFGLQETDAKTDLLPRIGLSFPINDRTTFHLQYGKFTQMPDLNFAYTGRGDMANILQGGNFVSSPFAWDLDPIETTQYEIGFGYQFSDYAAFDLTAYYRRTDKQLSIRQQNTIETNSDPDDNIPNTDAQPYNLFTNQNGNGDFSISKGVEISLRSKRVGGFLGRVNYTLTDARGTNSDPNGEIGALEQGLDGPQQIQPLEFMQKHQGSAILDYRSGSDQPIWGRNWGVNLLWRFSSGRRYTRVTSTGSGLGQRGADEGPLLTDSDPRFRVPLEPINASSTPFTTTLDLRLSRGFDIGPASATAYIYVQNLVNRKNVQNVYLRTGSATDDGFFSNPGLSRSIIQNRGSDYVQYYQTINLDNRHHYREDWGRDIFGQPRQVRIGIQVEY